MGGAIFGQRYVYFSDHMKFEDHDNNLKAIIVFGNGRKELKGKENHVNYYKELASMKFEDYKTNKVEFYNDEKVIFSQIKSNAIICKKKHKYLILAIYSMIPLAIFTIVIVALAMSFLYLAK